MTEPATKLSNAPPALLFLHPEHGPALATDRLDDGGVRVTYATSDGSTIQLDTHDDGATYSDPEGSADPEPDTPAPLDESLASLIARASSKKRQGRESRRLIEHALALGLVTVADSTGRRYGCLGSHAMDADELRPWLARTAADVGFQPTETACREAAFALLASGAVRAEVFIRLGYSRDRARIYLDLCDDAGSIVEVDANGWRILPDGSPAGIFFRRRPSALPLPSPTLGGDLAQLGSALAQSGAELVLLVAWLIGALAPGGPYPILALVGPAGSAKSTVTRRLRGLIDPRSGAARSLPRDERDLAVAAHGSHVLSFDNASGVPPAMADALCKLATGSGFATRQLYTNASEEVFDSARPMILNGIVDLLDRADFADRAIEVRLDPPATYRAERELDAAWEALRPGLIGALLGAASVALRHARDPVNLDLPRMADFARWVLAAERGLAVPWEPGTFLSAYADNRDDVARTSAETDLLATDLLAVLRVRGSPLVVTPADLLTMISDHLAAHDSPTVLRARADFLKSPRALSGHLARVAPILPSVGLSATRRSRSGRRGRRWELRYLDPDAEPEGPEE